MDGLLVVYCYYEVFRKCVVGNLVNDILVFLRMELFFGGLVDMFKYFWFVGVECFVILLYFYVFMGWEVVIVDWMDFYLFWFNKGRFFIKFVLCFFFNLVFCCSNL